MEDKSQDINNSLYLEQYSFITTAAIVGSVNKKVFVSLRDNRTLFGVLRTFDQFANLVLQDTVERVYLPDSKQYAEKPLGVYLIRGENVIMFGEMNLDTEDDHLSELQKIDFKEGKLEFQQELAAKEELTLQKIKTFRENGLTYR